MTFIDESEPVESGTVVQVEDDNPESLASGAVEFDPDDDDDDSEQADGA